MTEGWEGLRESKKDRGTAYSCVPAARDEQGRLLPQDGLTRAQLATVLQIWGQQRAAS